MKLAVLCSGGKDSTYALWLAKEEGHEVSKLVTMIPTRDDSWMYHYPNIRLVDQFSDCVGIPLVKSEAGAGPEKEVENLKKILGKLDVEGVVSGAIASNYQKSRIDRVCKELGLESLAPLWGKDPAKLLNDMLVSGLKIILVAVAAEGLLEEWLGRELNKKTIDELISIGKKHGINPSGEGGEYETLVLDAPFFKSRIKITAAEKIWHGNRGCYLIKEAEVEPKE